MTFYLLRWMLILSGTFLLPVLLIRAQPYDDSEMRAFLTPPDGCPAPCFMGIRPGVTTAAEAIAILHKSDWVQGNPRLDTRLFVDWPWSGQQSSWIDSQVDGGIQVADDVVEYIVVRTIVRVGDIKLLLGEPDKEQLQPWVVLYGPGSAFQYSAWYAATGIEMVTSMALCPIDSHLFHSRTIIRVRRSTPTWEPISGHASCPA